jgi:hypothetical protein
LTASFSIRALRCSSEFGEVTFHQFGARSRRSRSRTAVVRSDTTCVTRAIGSEPVADRGPVQKRSLPGLQAGVPGRGRPHSSRDWSLRMRSLARAQSTPARQVAKHTVTANADRRRLARQGRALYLAGLAGGRTESTPRRTTRPHRSLAADGGTSCCRRGRRKTVVCRRQQQERRWRFVHCRAMA